MRCRRSSSANGRTARAAPARVPGTNGAVGARTSRLLPAVQRLPRDRPSVPTQSEPAEASRQPHRPQHRHRSRSFTTGVVGRSIVPSTAIGMLKVGRQRLFPVLRCVLGLEFLERAASPLALGTINATARLSTRPSA